MQVAAGQPNIVQEMVNRYGVVFTRAQLTEAEGMFPRSEMSYIWKHMVRLERGKYSIESISKGIVPFPMSADSKEPPEEPKTAMPAALQLNSPEPLPAMVLPENAAAQQSRVFDLRGMRVIQEHADQSLVPAIDPNFIPFGEFSMIIKILSGQTSYLPIYIFGDTGYGKTKMIEQAAAKVRRELVEVSVTEQTTEEDLIGKYRLIDGTMIWEDGPVLLAMKRGAVLLLDEVDYATPRATSELQMVLRFRKYFIKKTGEMVVAKPGFTVLATGNTSGRGEGIQEFVGAGVLNRAFRERFRAVIQHGAPDARTEMKILTAYCNDFSVVERLALWAEALRKTKADGGSQYEVTTARLISMCELFQVMDINDAVKAGLSNFYSEEFESAAHNVWVNTAERLAQAAAAQDPNDPLNQAISTDNMGNPITRPIA